MIPDAQIGAMAAGALPGTGTAAAGAGAEHTTVCASRNAVGVRRLAVALFVVLSASAPLVIGKPFVFTLAVLFCVYAILALSLHLMLRIGQLCLSQAGFMGVGAYATALLTRDAGWPFLAGLIAACLIPAALAWLSGLAILRVKGPPFVLLTFALGQAITLVFTEWTVPFGGNSGLTGIPAAAIGALSLKSKQSFYLFSLGMLLISSSVCWRLLRGASGAVISGLAANEPLMQSLGINALRYRRMVFSLSAALAGLSGACYAHFIGYLSPDAFHVGTSINALIMNVVGGAAVLWGPLVGALLMVPLPEFFRGTIVYLQLFYGGTLVLLMMFAPRGLAGLLARRIKR